MKVIGIITALLITHLGYSQVDLLNTSLTVSTKKIAYIAYNNELKINGLNIDASTYILSRGERLNRYDSIFAYIPMLPIETDTLTIVHQGKEAAKIVYSIEHLLEPKIVFGDIKGSEVSVEELLENPGLHVSYEPQYAIANYYVSACELIITPLGKKSKTMIIYGNAFSPKQLKTISKLKPGDRLLFNQGVISDFLQYNEEKMFGLTLIVK
jgi:hypothetical protein